ncbi:nuclear transport factor 2 family protein [Nocardioides marmoriginsengisoli]|uniref:Nuclear transport factor 2 family protein n=1 Tax=Nocardioides marmoriginsengisoli TaxID=661483 RepID=A0A3N0CQW3_9ACTN|nr:nuclear transport factor 2 family protein [Nocardioides marmoriginsengisoli]RNL65303.1 nuclear transport factor 2 family protein [Nocardioides marmoriginsengisoli]
MSTPADIGLQRWHDVIASRDPAELTAMIAPDAVFRSPAVHTPQEGRDVVIAYLSAALVVLGPELAYHDTWQRENDAVLRFTTVVDGKQVEGVDLITWDDDGLIVSFTVMIRPMKALDAVIGAMAKQLFG